MLLGLFSRISRDSIGLRPEKRIHYHSVGRKAISDDPGNDMFIVLKQGI